MERALDSRFRPGDICTETTDGLGSVLVTSVVRVERLSADRRLEVYLGCPFQPGELPGPIDTFAIVVRDQTPSVSRTGR